MAKKAFNWTRNSSEPAKSAELAAIRYSPFVIAPSASALLKSAITLAAAVILFTGCKTRPFSPEVVGPFHKIGNYFLVNERLPSDVRRVAMLPLTAAENDHAAKNGRENLQPVLYGEITKARFFEVAPITPVQLERWTGRDRWKQDDELPADFLVRLKEATACDAILFSQLTYFRPYPPLAVGWRLLLVRTNGDVVWSVDEVFDAGDPAVVNSVRRYVLENEHTSAEIAKEVRSRPGALWSTRVVGLEWLNSPRQFARYTANATISTLSIK